MWDTCAVSSPSNFRSYWCVDVSPWCLDLDPWNLHCLEIEAGKDREGRLESRFGGLLSGGSGVKAQGIIPRFFFALPFFPANILLHAMVSSWILDSWYLGSFMSFPRVGGPWKWTSRHSSPGRELRDYMSALSTSFSDIESRHQHAMFKSVTNQLVEGSPQPKMKS